MKRQRSLISITMKEDRACKSFQSPRTLARAATLFSPTGRFQILTPDLQGLSARLGKIRYRKGRVPVDKIKLQLKQQDFTKITLPWVGRKRKGQEILSKLVQLRERPHLDCSFQGHYNLHFIYIIFFLSLY